jgi:hypothetical protein
MLCEAPIESQTPRQTVPSLNCSPFTRSYRILYGIEIGTLVLGPKNVRTDSETADAYCHVYAIRYRINLVYSCVVVIFLLYTRSVAIQLVSVAWRMLNDYDMRILDSTSVLASCVGCNCILLSSISVGLRGTIHHTYVTHTYVTHSNSKGAFSFENNIDIYCLKSSCKVDSKNRPMCALSAISPKCALFPQPLIKVHHSSAYCTIYHRCQSRSIVKNERRVR